MKEPYRKGLASHPDPESCAGAREGMGEALARAHAGEVLSFEIRVTGVPTVFDGGKATRATALIASHRSASRSLRPSACVETP